MGGRRLAQWGRVRGQTPAEVVCPLSRPTAGHLADRAKRVRGVCPCHRQPVAAEWSQAGDLHHTALAAKR